MSTVRNMNINMEKDKSEKRIFMEAAIRIAMRGWGVTNPNPLVGAVLVKENKIVAAGYHRAVGCPHAEIEALSSARKKGIEISGCTLYVNLEPCSHYGRTPPCAKAIIESGVKDVVASIPDPNPLVAGSGISMLESSGVRVTLGIMEEEARQLNEVFIKYITAKKPFVILKTAMTLDGKIAAASGNSKWITGEESRKLVHRIRSRMASVMAGYNTVRDDDPMLTVRLPCISFDDGEILERYAADKNVFDSVPFSVPCRNPIRIIVDSDGRTDPGCNIIRNESGTAIIMATTGRITPERESVLKGLGVSIIKTEADRDGHVDLPELMDELHRLEIDSVLLEGGGTLNASALESGIADKVMFFIAPKIAGGRNSLTPVEGRGAAIMDEALPLNRMTVERIGCDILVEGYPGKEWLRDAIRVC